MDIFVEINHSLDWEIKDQKEIEAVKYDLTRSSRNAKLKTMKYKKDCYFFVNSQHCAITFQIILFMRK